MPEKTPRDRGARLVDALIVWITPDRQLTPGLNRFEVRVSEAGRHVDRTPAVVKMDSLAPTGPAAAELVERPTPTARRLAAASISPNTRRAYSGALRRLDAWQLDGRPLEDATLAAYLAELHDQGRAPASASTTVPRCASGPASPGRRARPGNGRPGSSPATGGPPAIAAGARRGRSGRQTWPPSSPPATGGDAAAAASSPTRSPSSAAASTR